MVKFTGFVAVLSVANAFELVDDYDESGSELEIGATFSHQHVNPDVETGAELDRRAVLWEMPCRLLLVKILIFAVVEMQ